ncbi:GGDEF domain-containing protein [Aliikangiella sp. G2MR2-5]|uniref:GGDEF domain-containing protein n=1 Tax=Aliikangiella sp. G2MR2-5 TaxID=2788943 RepID=UPI0018A8E79B|nr:GGDEF domain-containing protein [Aliikangiella sp. G2MR2-5]
MFGQRVNLIVLTRCLVIIWLTSTYCYASSESLEELNLSEYQELLSTAPQRVVDELGPYLISEPSSKHFKKQLEVYYLLCNAHYFLSQRSEIRSIAQQALSLAENTQSYDYIARFYGMLAIASLASQEFEKATQNAMKGTQIAREHFPDSTLLGEVLMLEANVHYESGSIENALRVMVEANDIFTEKGDDKNRSEAMGSIALMYDELGQPQQAIDFHLKSLELIDVEDNIIEASITYYNVALTFRNMGKLSEGKKYAELSLSYAQRADDIIGSAYALYELAAIEEEEGMYSTSLSRIEDILPVFDEAKINGMIILTHLLRARLKARLSLPGWEHDLSIARPLVEKVGSLKRLIALAKSEALVYRLIGDKDLALHAYQRWVELHNRQLKETQEQATRRYQAMFELKEAETVNKLLLAEKKLAEAQLVASENKEIIMMIAGFVLLMFLASLLYILKLQIQTKQKFRDLALIDELTKTRNRRSITVFAERAIQEAELSNQPLSLAMLDIDYFKRFNDVYGHDIGDQVLQVTATAISETLRASDALGRWGGEEWLIVLPGSKSQNLVQLFKRIQSRLENIELAELANEKITVSMGVAEKEQKETLDSIVKRADDALYLAKNRGRNRIELSSVQSEQS